MIKMVTSDGQRTTEEARVNSVNSVSGISHCKMKLKKDNIIVSRRKSIQKIILPNKIKWCHIEE